MRAVLVEQFGRPPVVRQVGDPTPRGRGVVVQVAATGLCRSDWHGWMGHDPDIALPHVPGHELAGTVVAVGADVDHWQVGARVTVPFVTACGRCTTCAAGAHQVCPHQTQPGFTGWGSFAEFVALDEADVNLVGLPDAIDMDTAAGLGCLVGTAYRAVVAQGRVGAGQWVAVHGCGGVGLAAVMIASAAGARVVAVDVSPAALELAREFGAEVLIHPGGGVDVAGAVQDATDGGAHVSLDALGSPATCAGSVSSLRRHGRHVQVGLLAESGGRPPVPMDRVISHELVIVGSHGLAAHAYPPMLALIAAGRIDPARLVRRVIDLDATPAALAAMGDNPAAGITVIRP